MGIVEEEADESGYWLKMLTDAGFCSDREVEALVDEGSQLVAITVTSISTARGGRRSK